MTNNEIKEEFSEDPLINDLDDQKDDCEENPPKKIEDFLDSYDGNEYGLSGEEQADVGGSYEIMSQSSSFKENVSGVMTNNEIKEEFSEDPLINDLDDQKQDDYEENPPKKIEESLDSYDGNDSGLSGEERADVVGGSYEIMSQSSSFKEEEIEEIFIKEEIQDECLEDQSPLPDEIEERLTFQQSTHSMASASPEMLMQNSYQEKAECLTSCGVEVVLSQFNSEVLLCDRRGKLENKLLTVEKPFKCSLCKYRTAQRDRLLEHERIHACTKPFKCSSCHYQTVYLRNLRRHKITHSGKKPFKCASCEYQTAQLGDLSKHVKIHTGEKPFKCSSCHYQTVRSSQLQRHLRTHSIEKPFKCSSCHYRATQIGYLRKHEKIHTGEKPFKCGSCSYQAAEFVTLRKHERTHTGEKPFKCSSCQYQAARKDQVQEHERIHTGEKILKCSSCPYQTVRIGNLHRHERTHTGEKPFKCNSCSYHAADLGTLRKHERTHTGEKPYKCSSCHYQTAHRYLLQEHERTHTGEQPFKCSSCHYKTARRANLLKHLSNHHLLESTKEETQNCST